MTASEILAEKIARLRAQLTPEPSVFDCEMRRRLGREELTEDDKKSARLRVEIEALERALAREQRLHPVYSEAELAAAEKTLGETVALLGRLRANVKVAAADFSAVQLSNGGDPTPRLEAEDKLRRAKAAVEIVNARFFRSSTALSGLFVHLARGIRAELDRLKSEAEASVRAGLVAAGFNDDVPADIVARHPKGAAVEALRWQANAVRSPAFRMGDTGMMLAEGERPEAVLHALAAHRAILAELRAKTISPHMMPTNEDGGAA